MIIIFENVASDFFLLRGSWDAYSSPFFARAYVHAINIHPLVSEPLFSRMPGKMLFIPLLFAGALDAAIRVTVSCPAAAVHCGGAQNVAP